MAGGQQRDLAPVQARVQLSSPDTGPKVGRRPTRSRNHLEKRVGASFGMSGVIGSTRSRQLPNRIDEHSDAERNAGESPTPDDGKKNESTVRMRWPAETVLN